MRLAGLLFAAAAAAGAQQAIVSPHIGFVYPAGGRQGTSFEATIGGEYLNGANAVYVSGKPGVRVVVKQYVRPLTPQQASDLREQMQKLLEKQTATKTPLTPEETKTVAGIRAKLLDFQRKPTSAAISESAIVQVTIAPDAAPGDRELRIVATAGLTNPVTFAVGTLPEFSRKPTKVPAAFSVVNGATPPNRGVPESEPPMEIALPAVVNGQAMPAVAHRYRFPAHKGQRLTIAVRARGLTPYISDAVPGWFQAAIELRDGSGKEIAAADHYRFQPDPVICYEVPADGEYELDIHDSIYRGREDFVYRVTIGELPFITGIFPLGGRAGRRTALQMRGWNLPATRIVEDAGNKSRGVYPIALGASNAVDFAVDSLPEATARAADRREHAQKIKLPVIVNGRIERAGQAHFFRLEMRAGEELVVEVEARRLDSPLDSILRLTDAQGRELACNDDFDDKAAGMLTHQADSRIAFQAPAKGTYYLQLADAQGKGGPEYVYRLRVSHPQPDFELRVTPASVNMRAGATIPIAVHALRRDGFTGEISLNLKDAPQGFALSGATVPSGQDKVRITLTAPSAPADMPRAIRLEGRAQIDGREVRRVALPADERMQAFAYYHLVAADEWMVEIVGAGQARMPVRAETGAGVKVPAGGEAAVAVIVAARLAGQVQLALNEPVLGISIVNVSAGPSGVSVIVRADSSKLKPGWKSNLILDAYVDRPNPSGGAKPRPRQLLGTLPAIPIEVVGETGTSLTRTR